MSGFQFSPDAFHFDSTFAGIPVVIEYEVDVSEDHAGRDVSIVPTLCVIGDRGVDLCEDAGLFHTEQLKTWLAEAESHFAGDVDDGEPDGFDADDGYVAAAAEDRFIAERDHAHYALAGL